MKKTIVILLTFFTLISTSKCMDLQVCPKTAQNPQAIAAFDKYQPAIVQIQIEPKLLKKYGYKRIPQSGVVISNDGYVLTNYHPLRDAKKVQVKIYPDSQYDAVIVGVDKANDFAVLKIEALNEILTFVELKEHQLPKLNDNVYTVGFPIGFNPFMGNGKVDQILKTVKTNDNLSAKNVIHSVNAIHPWSGGGALLNEKGEFIGLNTSINNSSKPNAPNSFAIPVNTIIDSLDVIMEDKN